MIEPSSDGRVRPAARQAGSLRRTAAGVAVVALVTVAAGALLTYCAKAPTGGPGTPHGRRGGGPGAFSGAGGRLPVTVGVAQAGLGAMPIELSALGTVTPLATINVNARVSGQLDRVAFREGEAVRKGQLLAVIDPRPFEVALQQAQAQLQRDQALLQTARLDLARYQTLKAQDSIAGQTLDTQTALVRQDEALVAADQAGVANARLNLSFTHITSPVAGRVGLRQVDPGNQIAANQTTPVAVVTQIDPISVVFTVPEGSIAQVVARHGGAGLPVTAYDRAGGAVLARGVLQTLDNQIDTTTGTVKARAVFANPGQALFPNQFVNVVLLVDTLQNQVIVPTTAVRHGPQGDFVWVLQPDRTVQSRPVTLGASTPETVAVASGLRAGETVITEGGDRLRDGSSVILPRAGGQGAAAGGGPPRGGRPGGHGRWRHRGEGGGQPQGPGGE